MSINLDTVAEFTWFWNHDFFLETNEGNFIGSDPGYPGGDNTIRHYYGTIRDFCRDSHVSFGRDKGTHTIRSYCGENVVFVSLIEIANCGPNINPESIGYVPNNKKQP